jgi:hypothetical protein
MGGRHSCSLKNWISDENTRTTAYPASLAPMHQIIDLLRPPAAGAASVVIFDAGQGEPT